jgi:hypothetical protein
MCVTAARDPFRRRAGTGRSGDGEESARECVNFRRVDRNMERTRTLVLGLVTVLVLATAAPAVAQTPIGDAYGGALGDQTTGAGGGPEGTVSDGGDEAVSGQSDEPESGGTLGEEENSVAAETAVGGSIRTLTSSDGPLPFTGADLTIIVLAGGALLALGIGLRRRSRAVPRSH